VNKIYAKTLLQLKHALTNSTKRKSLATLTRLAMKKVNAKSTLTRLEPCSLMKLQPSHKNALMILLISSFKFHVPITRMSSKTEEFKVLLLLASESS